MLNAKSAAIKARKIHTTALQPKASITCKITKTINPQDLQHQRLKKLQKMMNFLYILLLPTVLIDRCQLNYGRAFKVCLQLGCWPGEIV